MYPPLPRNVRARCRPASPKSSTMLNREAEAAGVLSSNSCARVDAASLTNERLRRQRMTEINSSTHPESTHATPDIDVIVEAPEAAPKTTTFAELGVREEIVRALAENGIEHTFAIQELTLPLALAGDDLIGQARTGMGKTFAFGVPLLHRIVIDESRPLSGIPRALIVVPTRELCLQVYDDLAAAARYLRVEAGGPSDRKLTVTSIYGGRPYEPQIEALRNGADVVVGTPGRLLDLAQQ